MRFKVGERVLVNPTITDPNASLSNDAPEGVELVEEMKAFAGRWVTIVDRGTTGELYRIKEDGSCHDWWERLFLPSPARRMGQQITPNEQLNTNDPAAHPAHYTYGKIEVIDFIQDKDLNFALGNAVKYIVRAGHKSEQGMSDKERPYRTWRRPSSTLTLK